MRGIFWFKSVALLAGLTLAVTACNRHASSTPASGKIPPKASPTATTHDVEIASHAMNIEDILLMLKRGDSQESIIHRVRERRITQKIVEAQEFDLLMMGARRQLIAELKKESNVLTETQEIAYGRLHRSK